MGFHLWYDAEAANAARRLHVNDAPRSVTFGANNRTILQPEHQHKRRLARFSRSASVYRLPHGPSSRRAGDGTERRRPGLGVSWAHGNSLWLGWLRGNAYFELRVYRQGWNGGTKVLTTDPLTGLALYPATDSRLRLGNEPTQLPESQVCKSKMQVDLYSVYDSKVNATVAWYDAHLPGFKKTPAYAANRSQDTFYNADRILAVSVTGSSGKAGENTETYSVVYSRFSPPVRRKRLSASISKK